MTSTACDLSTCRQQFSKQSCKCYADLSIIGDMKFDTNDDKTEAVKKYQLCAYESDEGYLFPCDQGCCDGGCPGQCDGVTPRPPEKAYTPPTTNNPKPKKLSNLFIYWSIMMLWFLLLSLL